jgi:hypothetical protein
MADRGAGCVEVLGHGGRAIDETPIPIGCHQTLTAGAELQVQGRRILWEEPSDERVGPCCPNPRFRESSISLLRLLAPRRSEAVNLNPSRQLPKRLLVA